ncbi:MAG TPA: lysophospholipid acyltransferase family protein, partial [Micromonosporaceae bacterium]
RGGAYILAANHIGAFDPFVLTAACARRRLAPRIMATGGLFRAPVVGALMRTAGHIRVERRSPTVTEALGSAEEALAIGSVVLAYPEGRITLDPAMWPERGKTGLARLAVASGAAVVPVAQWGAHLVLPWGAPRHTLGRLLWSLLHRPIVRVHFGQPLVFKDTGQGARAVRDATDAIMDRIVADLTPLRTDEPRLPRWIDPGRPLSTVRTHRISGRYPGELRASRT